MKPRILVVDDNRGMCELLELGLAGCGFEVRWTTEPHKALELLQQDTYEAVVTDLNMPGQNGIELTRQLLGNRPDLPVIVITASHCFDNLIGQSDAMRQVFDLLARVAAADVSVLILGESERYRVLAATNQDLETAVTERRFRGDLYYRLNVVQLCLPPLRVRGNDAPLLAQHLLDQAAARLGKRIERLTPKAAERLLAYAWPGNVRELQNCIDRAVALTAYDQIGVDDLPERVRDYRPSQVIVASDHPSELLTMDEIERRYILRVLDIVGGNKSLAAQILGFDRRTLYRKLQRYSVAS